MYKKVLIATDGSDLADKALDQGLELAKTCGAEVIIMTVTDIWSALEMAHHVQAGEQNPVADYEAAATAAAEKVLNAANDKAAKAGVECTTVHVRDRHPAQGIIDTAKEKSCDLIIMSSHGRRGIEKILLGSVAAEVITHCEIPVLVAK